MSDFFDQHGVSLSPNEPPNEPPNEQQNAFDRAVPPYSGDLSSQIAREMASPATIEETRIYFSAMRADLMARVAELESLLGFIESSDELAVRVGRLEKFCKIAG